MKILSGLLELLHCRRQQQFHTKQCFPITITRLTRQDVVTLTQGLTSGLRKPRVLLRCEFVAVFISLFEVLTALPTKAAVFLDATPFNRVETYRHIKELVASITRFDIIYQGFSLHHQGRI
jgi:hypothetical protein